LNLAVARDAPTVGCTAAIVTKTDMTATGRVLQGPVASAAVALRDICTDVQDLVVKVSMTKAVFALQGHLIVVVAVMLVLHMLCLCDSLHSDI